MQEQSAKMDESLLPIGREIGLHYYNPTTNDLFNIPERMKLGTTIVIAGLFDDFRMDFLRGSEAISSQIFLSYHVDIMKERLHIDCTSGEKQRDTRHLPYRRGQPFKMYVKAVDVGFELKINKEPPTVFELREVDSYSDVQFLRIMGEVDVCSLHFIPSLFVDTHHKITIPTRAQVGDIYCIRATATSSTSGADLSGDELIVDGRNSCEHLVRFAYTPCKYDTSKRSQSPCQFKGFRLTKHQNFELKIVVEPKGFNCWLDKHHMGFKRHRLPFTEVTDLMLYDMSLEQFIMDRARCEIPKELSARNARCDIEENDALVLFPKIPLRMQLPKIPRMCISISGEFFINAKRMAINLDGDAMRDPMIVVYHYIALLDEKRPLVLQNDRNVKWSEERIEEKNFPYFPGGPFQLHLFCDESGLFTTTVDGAQHTSYKSKVDYNRIEYLCVGGDIEVSRIVVMKY